uniref:Uncharacterized protein n=1 Tax=Klebsiella pneumoniae TaxID=573 RepID=A0A6M3HGT1_KLEPN|nr:hypothetical protein [Klebsiella pneumoniae]
MNKTKGCLIANFATVPVSAARFSRRRRRAAFRGAARRGTDAPFACSVPESVNKHRDRDLKSICQRPHVIEGQTAFTTEDPADE